MPSGKAVAARLQQNASIQKALFFTVLALLRMG
jgi:hypothetical protein